MNIQAKILRDYIACALWSSTDENGEPLDSNFSVFDLSKETMDKLTDIVTTFYEANKADCTQLENMGYSIGHGLWLTQNHHGAGFWDNGAKGNPDYEAAQRLNEACKALPEIDLYVGDNGNIYA